MKNLFQAATTHEVINRINSLTPDSKPLWGKMSVAQMLAHCNAIYEVVFEDIHPKPGPVKKFLLKLFVKNSVVNTTPYKRNTRTAPEFFVKDEKEFETEKNRLVSYITMTQELGTVEFEGREYANFGTLTAEEWCNLFYKHLDHHLGQFNV